MKSLKHLVSGVVACLVFMAMTQSASAAIETREILKTFFETGDVPTQDQFSNLIDSFLNYNDDGLSITGVGTSGSSTHAARKFEDDVVDVTNTFAPIGGPGEIIPDMATEFGGQSGFLALQLSDALGETHYGYLQVNMENPALVDPAGIHVDYFVFNDTADAPVTIFDVPEPASLFTLTLGAAALLARRRKR